MRRKRDHGGAKHAGASSSDARLLFASPELVAPLHLSGHYEIAKYYTLNEHTRVPDVLLISTRVWDGLTDREREWLSAAVAESTGLQRELWKEAVQEALSAVRAAGVEVIQTDPIPFAERVEGMFGPYRNDPELWSLIQRIRG